MIVRLTAAAIFLATGSFAANAQDAAAGEKSFNKCRACHQVGETAKNGVGPVLNGLFGRKSGTIEGYSYSDANKNSGITWDDASLDAFLKKPRKFVKGTRMSFPGLKKQADRDNLIAYIKEKSK